MSASEVRPIRLDGNELPWVDNVKHLGHILERDNSMKLDRREALSLAKRIHFYKSSIMFQLTYSLRYLAHLLPIYTDRIYGIYLVKIARNCTKATT